MFTGFFFSQLEFLMHETGRRVIFDHSLTANSSSSVDGLAQNEHFRIETILSCRASYGPQWQTRTAFLWREPQRSLAPVSATSLGSCCLSDNLRARSFQQLPSGGRQKVLIAVTSFRLIADHPDDGDDSLTLIKSNSQTFRASANVLMHCKRMSGTYKWEEERGKKTFTGRLLLSNGTWLCELPVILIPFYQTSDKQFA